MDISVTIGTADIVINVNRLSILPGFITMAEAAVYRLHGDFTVSMFFKIPDVAVTTGTGVSAMGRGSKSTGINFVMTL
jgi:cation transport ATPase